MNRKIGMYSSIINLTAVIGFAVCMLTDFSFGCYFSSMLIAFSFVAMTSAYTQFSSSDRKTAGYAALAFASIYVAIILLVYFAQLTTVRLGGLNDQAQKLLDFQKMGLLFNYDMLGYALMSLSTFFAGLTVCPKTKADKWLKALLMIHGIFFISCLIVPLLGLFHANGSKWIGIAVLEFWCIYFCPIGALSFVHFKNKTETI